MFIKILLGLFILIFVLLAMKFVKYFNIARRDLKNDEIKQNIDLSAQLDNELNSEERLDSDL